MSADEILFRCSSLRSLDTRGKSKDEVFGEVSKKEMRRAYIQHVYNRFKSLDNKFISKGNKQEEEGITLLSRIKKYPFFKNEIRLSNEFITGEIDTYLGESIYKADHTFDTKISWDIHTFYAAIDSKLNPEYEYQGRGYMALSGAKKHTVAYCLVNTPLSDVQRELYSESFRWNNNETPAWVQIQAIANMVYDRETFDSYIQSIGCFPNDRDSEAAYAGFVEIPMTERLHEKTIEHEEEKVKAIYDRVKECREYMNEKMFKLQLATP